MFKIKSDGPGVNVTFENTITAGVVIKRRKNGAVKVRLCDDAKNTYDVWLSDFVIQNEL